MQEGWDFLLWDGVLGCGVVFFLSKDTANAVSDEEKIEILSLED